MTDIQPKTKTIKKLKTIKQASYKDVPTGDYKIETVVHEGKKIEVEVPITQRIHMNPERKEVTEKIEVFEIEYLNEVHEFSDIKDAEEFMKNIGD